MKVKFIFILCVIFNLNCFSQNKEIRGEWILVRVLFSDGRRLEINNPQYSMSLRYVISSNSLKISIQKFKADFTDNQIIMDGRTLNYNLKEGYLIVEDKADNKTYYFLKADDFIKKFPEFTLKTTEIDGETVYIDEHKLYGFEFGNELSYNDYMTRHTKDRNSKDFKNLYFKLEFILTKDNQVKNVKILNSIDKEFDDDYLKAFEKASRFFKNNSNKNLLLYVEQSQLKWAHDVHDKDEKKLYKLRSEGLKSYRENKFEETIEKFSQIKELNLDPYRFQSLFEETMIKLGISYLAVGNNDKACETFNLIGDKTNFSIRNYLIDFCSK
jgi:hypothetical protein